MFLTRLKAGAVVLLASCTMASLTTLATERAQAGRDDGRPVAASAAVGSASPGPPHDPAADAAAKAKKPQAAGGDGVVQSKGPILTPDGKLVYVNVYSTDPNADQKDLFNFANVFVMPRLSRRIKGMGIPRILGNLTFAMRVWLKPDRMRAHNLSSVDIMKAVTPSRIVGREYDLRLMSLVEDRSGIPAEGWNLVIVAAVDRVLHFRIFDSDGKKVVDTDEKRLTEQARPIEDLRKQLVSLRPPHELTESEKYQAVDAVLYDPRGDPGAFLELESENCRVVDAVTSIVGHTRGSAGRHDPFTGKTSQSKEYVQIYTGRYNKPEQYGQIVLRANDEGEILRLKDVGELELIPQLFDNDSDVDGHPSDALVLKQASGSNAADVIEAIKEELEQTRKESVPLGMNFEVIPLENPGMIYAVIKPPLRSTLEYTSAKCHELGAIAKGIDEITSVASLAGYQIRTEYRGSDAGTCLIQLKNRSDRKLTSRQIIEKLEEKCRTMSVHLEFFEPPAVSVFVAAGGFSVRVLDRTNSNNDERLGRVPETYMDDLLKRKGVERLFVFLASSYPQYELVINNDVAMRRGVSIAYAMENLAIVVGGNVQAERKSRRLAEDFSTLFVKNDRGELEPYR
ncbi:MAG TPA: efflux RND transporter permease subunit, partial [Isosphaeraceae bacterium]|nr:efflux RND transporter permease subunit [Isosphaeraceae bacterium]